MTYAVCVISLCELTKREKWIYSDTHRITLHKWGEPTRWHPTLYIEYIHFSGFFGWFWLFWFIQLNCQCGFITSTPTNLKVKLTSTSSTGTSMMSWSIQVRPILTFSSRSAQRDLLASAPSSSGWIQGKLSLRTVYRGTHTRSINSTCHKYFYQSLQVDTKIQQNIWSRYKYIYLK